MHSRPDRNVGVMEELHRSTEESLPEALLDSLGFREVGVAWLVGLGAVSFLVALACNEGLLKATTHVAEAVGEWLFVLLIWFALS